MCVRVCVLCAGCVRVVRPSQILKKMNTVNSAGQMVHYSVDFHALSLCTVWLFLNTSLTAPGEQLRPIALTVEMMSEFSLESQPKKDLALYIGTPLAITFP